MICGLIWMKADKVCCLSADAFLHFQWNSYSLKTIRASDLTVSLWSQYRAYWQLTHWTHLVVNYNTVEIWHLWGNHRSRQPRLMWGVCIHHTFILCIQYSAHMFPASSQVALLSLQPCAEVQYTVKGDNVPPRLWCYDRTMQTHNSAKD